MKNKKIGVLVVAGGISSRMNDFKPLMNIGRYSMIETTIMNYKSIGIDDIVVVTGYRANDIQEKLKNYNLCFVNNKDYMTTQMFDSVCLGLNQLINRVDLIFITPSDSPFVQAFTLKRMSEEMQTNELNFIQPAYLHKNGHPILVSSECAKIILKHDGTMGLKGAILKITSNYKNMSFADPGIVLDADTEKDYLNLLHYNENKNIPTYDLCKKIQDYFEVTDEVKIHSKKVTEVALHIYQTLYDKGIFLNKNIIVSASMLHDIAKGKKNHDKLGAQWIFDMGYEEVSKIIAEHMNLSSVTDRITEKEVVYLADKLVEDNNLETIEQSFSRKEELYKNNKEVLRIIEKRKEQAMYLYLNIFGDTDNMKTYPYKHEKSYTDKLINSSPI